MFTGSTSGCKRWQVVSPCKVFTVASERPTIHLSSGFNYGQFSDISTDKLRFAELWPRGFVTGGSRICAIITGDLSPTACKWKIYFANLVLYKNIVNTPLWSCISGWFDLFFVKSWVFSDGRYLYVNDIMVFWFNRLKCFLSLTDFGSVDIYKQNSFMTMRRTSLFFFCRFHSRKCGLSSYIAWRYTNSRWS